MSQYRARKKALNQKRDQMMDLFVDSRIKLANKPTTYGEFYDYVTDLDRPRPKAKRLSARATPQVKPSIPAQVIQTEQTSVQQHTKPTPKPAPAEVKVDKHVENSQVQALETKGNSDFWENYTQ